MDPKIRFGNQHFKNRLKLARQYKRPSRVVSESNFKKILKTLGLDTFLKQATVCLVTLVLILSVYFPSWFFIKQINVYGAGDIENNVRTASFNFFSLHKLWPQQNLILLNKQNLSNYLEKNLTGILKVTKIEKKPFHVLNIYIEKRTTEYLLETQTGRFTVSNDGKVIEEISPSTSPTSSTISLLKIKLNLNSKPMYSETILNSDWLNSMNSIRSTLPEIFQNQISEIEIGDIKIPELGVLFKNNTKMYFNTSQDLQKSFERIRLLLSQVPSSEWKKLAYIDIRFAGKGYICYKNSVCDSQNPIFNEPQKPELPTTTLEKLN